MANSPSAIQTFTGRFIDVLALDPAEIDIRDIAHSLSLKVRFNGHPRFFWSVASHSLLVAALCPPEDRLAALLHDADEAIGGDMPRPIKYTPPLAAYRGLLRDAQAAIAARFGLPAAMPPSIKEADNLTLWAEATALFDAGYSQWDAGWQPPASALGEIRALSAYVVRRDMEEVEAEFLAAFEMYGGCS